MKKAFLSIVVPALLATLGFAQTPAANTNTDQTTVRGCLGGSDGNYTVAEDNTGHIFKITTSSVDLKPHLSHDVTLIGHKASGASSAPADNSLSVTELKMISEHCAVSAAASIAPVTTSAEPPSTSPANSTAPVATVDSADTANAPAADATAPVATIPTPAETASTPATSATLPAEITVTPAAADTAPVATIITPAETAPTPVARPRKRSETRAAGAPAVTASSASETAGAPAATAVTPIATDSSSPEPVSTPAPVATTPTAPSNSWSLWLLIAFGVLVVALGTMFPFLNRWRKRKSLEGTDAPNLSFNRDVSSDQNKSDPGQSDRKGPRKAA